MARSSLDSSSSSNSSFAYIQMDLSSDKRGYCAEKTIINKLTTEYTYTQFRRCYGVLFIFFPSPADVAGEKNGRVGNALLPLPQSSIITSTSQCLRLIFIFISFPLDHPLRIVIVPTLVSSTLPSSLFPSRHDKHSVARAALFPTWCFSPLLPPPSHSLPFLQKNQPPSSPPCRLSSHSTSSSYYGVLLTKRTYTDYIAFLIGDKLHGLIELLRMLPI